MKIKFIIIISLLLFCSCNSDDYNHKIITLENTGNFKFFDLKSLKKDSVFKFVEYKYMSGKINDTIGKATVFLIDFNNNNSFNDKTDILTLRDNGKESLNSFTTFNQIGLKPLFSINSTVISANKIDVQEGKYSIKYSITDKLIDSVHSYNRHIDKIPNINFCSINTDNEFNFLDFKKENKFLFVEFWTTTCSPCIQNIPMIKKIQQKYSHKINIISINADKKNTSRVIKFISKNNLNWIQGFTNTEIRKKMDLNIYPKGYLFDRNSNLISSNISPAKVLEFLDKN